MIKIAPFLTIITFALWWGGFTFYAAWVIPTAHEVTGNHILTGMITQRVSNVLNVLITVFIAVSMVTFYVEKRKKRQWIPLSIIALGLLVLVVLHPKMDTFVQVETQSLTAFGAAIIFVFGKETVFSFTETLDRWHCRSWRSWAHLRQQF